MMVLTWSLCSQHELSWQPVPYTGARPRSQRTVEASLKASAGRRLNGRIRPYNGLALQWRCSAAAHQPSPGPHHPRADANDATNELHAAALPLEQPAGPSLGVLALYTALAPATLAAASSAHQTELGLLTALETIYIALHLKPLLPLASLSPVDKPFMHAYTVPAYFITELWAFALLYHMQVAPTWLLGGHAALHVAITLTSGLAPQWTLGWNLQRAKPLGSQRLPVAAFALLLNAINFGDMAAHIFYLCALVVALQQQHGPGPATASFALGVAASYVFVRWLPQLQRHLAASAEAARASAAALDQVDLSGVHVLLTGGSSGAGKEAARILYQRGATVIITSPSLERAAAARLDILAEAGNKARGIGRLPWQQAQQQGQGQQKGQQQQQHQGQQQQQHQGSNQGQQQQQRNGQAGDVVAMQLDLADLASVRRLAADVQARFPRLHVLVCNAGTSYWEWPCKLTAQGIDATFAVNHLGHFLLTKLLLPTMESTAAASHGSGGSVPGAEHAGSVSSSQEHASSGGLTATVSAAETSYNRTLPPARIVFVTSDAYWWWSYQEGIQISSLAAGQSQPTKQQYTPWQSYGQSKLAVLLAAQCFAKRLQHKGAAGVPVVALHPGIAPTSMSRHMGLAGTLTNAGLVLAGCSASSMARSIAAAAVDPALANAPFTYRSGMRPARMMGCHASDEHLAEQLWQLSEELTNRQ